MANSKKERMTRIGISLQAVLFWTLLITSRPFTVPRRLIKSNLPPAVTRKPVPSSTQIQSMIADQEWALEVFNAVARGGKYENDSDDIIEDDLLPYPMPSIGVEQLGEMLHTLRIEASQEEVNALLKYLDEDGDGQVSFDEFLPWYDAAAEAAKSVAANFQELLLGRRTVDQFDSTAVDDEVLERAIACAIAAPNRSGSEPWRFIQVGPETVKELAALQTSKLQMEESRGDNPIFTQSRWTDIPGWCVVTTKLTPGNPVVELEDYKSTACAVQNLMLSLWSEGVGSKWTSGPVQRTPDFARMCGVDSETEKIIGVIWFGFPKGGFANAADPKRRKKTVADVLHRLP